MFSEEFSYMKTELFNRLYLEMGQIKRLYSECVSFIQDYRRTDLKPALLQIVVVFMNTRGISLHCTTLRFLHARI